MRDLSSTARVAGRKLRTRSAIALGVGKRRVHQATVMLLHLTKLAVQRITSSYLTGSETLNSVHLFVLIPFATPSTVTPVGKLLNVCVVPWTGIATVSVVTNVAVSSTFVADFSATSAYSPLTRLSTGASPVWLRVNSSTVCVPKLVRETPTRRHRCGLFLRLWLP